MGVRASLGPPVVCFSRTHQTSSGHTLFHEGRIAFVGDCVFLGSIGRTDIPGADARRLKKSIVEEILTLPDDYTLCPGHGPVTTVGHEKQENMILAQLLRMPD